MWYSKIKVGILEIDMDHNNIDTMLQLYFAGTVTEAYLENVIDALIAHFDHEEQVIVQLGRAFPPEHKAEHERLVRLLETLIDEWKAKKIDGQELAENVRNVLMLHVAEFDIKLGTANSSS